MGLSPVSLNASGLRGFFTSFEKYRWNRACAHYITSSPTSTAGDILLFYHTNHAGPKVNHTSTNFLAYALSTDAAVLGPQWTNHSVALIDGPREWLDTDTFNSEDVQHQADGELLVYTRNTANAGVADSPGYLLIDYDITFSKRMLNARVQTIPSSLFKWIPTSLSLSSGETAGDPIVMRFGGVNIDGTTPTGVPSGSAVGEIFQIVFDTTNAVISGFSSLTDLSFNYSSSGNTMTMPVTTGTTIYGVIVNTSSIGQMLLYPTYNAVFAGNNLRAGTTATYSWQVPVVMCCVGSVNAVFTQANIG
jgi:hypothetical protein